MIQVHNIPNFYMVVGLPGSGKSTYIKNHFSDYEVHSSDAIREELSGDVNNQNINKRVFEVLHKRIKEDLHCGKNVVYDATNISWKRRKAFLQELNSISCWKCCFLIATPFEQCLIRNSQRERVVPNEVIKRMYKNFDIPWYNEGWDRIFIAYTDSTFTDFYGSWHNFIPEHLDFNQENKWHNETLGKHCEKTLSFVREHASELNRLTERECAIAAALHDCGKPFCKTFTDSKGSVSDTAHYYQHENVGAYKSLFYGKDEDVENLLIAALIRYHMILHFSKSWKQKTIDKYEKEFTGHKWLQEMDFYKALKLLHEGDKSAH